MMDTVKEFHWQDTSKQRIYAVEWPVKSAKAVIGIIHGIGEHARRYDHLVDHFRQQGYACLGYDRMGHGRSEGKKGFAASYDLYLNEVGRLVVECDDRYPGVPIFLYGHSMGGQILLQYLIRRRPEIAGAIISAPHISLPFKPNSFLIGVGKIMRRIKPDFSQPTPLDVNQLSRDPIQVERYLADPLVHNMVSAQTGIDLLEIAAELNTWKGKLHVPCLLMHGDADGITSVEGSRNFAARNPANLELKIWGGYFHELHNEPTWKEVAEYAEKWMAGQIISSTHPA